MAIAHDPSRDDENRTRREATGRHLRWTCFDHIEHRRNDEAYLDALGAERIPDLTTAGDFCRRFGHMQLILVMQAINRVRQTVWRQQEDSFFDCATIEADGTIVETAAEKKEGIGISYKGKWGYHPLVVTLAETQELLYIHNRPGNPTSKGTMQTITTSKRKAGPPVRHDFPQQNGQNLNQRSLD